MAGELFVRALTVPERRQLQQVVHTHRDARVLRRAQAVSLSSRGKTAYLIADLLERSWSGVRKIINRFNREGFASLFDKQRAGRPSKATDRYVASTTPAITEPKPC